MFLSYLEQESVGGGGENGLSGLDNLAEGNSSGTQGQHGEGVGQGGPDTYRGQLLPVISGEGGGLAEASQPDISPRKKINTSYVCM